MKSEMPYNETESQALVETGYNCPRLKGQKGRILECLQNGPCTNAELNGISMNFRARLSELRKSGYTIKAHHEGGGLWTYSLAT